MKRFLGDSFPEISVLNSSLSYFCQAVRSILLFLACKFQGREENRVKKASFEVTGMPMLKSICCRSLQAWCLLLTLPAPFLSKAKANTQVLWVGVSDRKGTAWLRLQGAAGLSGIGSNQTDLWEGLWVRKELSQFSLALADPLCFLFVLLVKHCHC